MPKYFLNSFFAGILTVTFSMTPYASAEDQTPVGKLKTRMKDLKIETVKSYPELFARMSARNTGVNPVVFRELAKTFQAEKFPKYKIQEFKYKGKDALKVINQIGNDQVVIEYLFNGDEVLKINGVVFNKHDVSNSTYLAAKIQTIPIYAKMLVDYRKKIFKASITPTYDQWKRLSRVQRAEYHLRYRELLEAAYKVHNTPPFKVVSSVRSFDQWASEMMIGNQAQAEEAAIGAKPGSPPPGKTVVTGGPATRQQREKAAIDATKLGEVMGYNQATFVPAGQNKGPSCIVAGYAREWKGVTCPWDGGTTKGKEEFYKKFPTSQACREKSGPTFIACNPLIYGFNGNQEPHCINTETKDGPDNFNHATHGDGPCERRSPLGTAKEKLDFINNILKKGEIQADGKIRVRTKANGETDLVTDDKEFFNAIFPKLREKLDEYINSARSICDVSASGTDGKPTKWVYNENAMPPKNGSSPKKDVAHQHGACDAMMKRALAVQNLLTLDDQITTTIASSCSEFGPSMAIEEIIDDAGVKVCKCKDKLQFLDPSSKSCVKPNVPPLDKPPVAEEPAFDPSSREVGTRGTDCDGFVARWMPGNGCPGPETSEIFIGAGLAILIACGISIAAEKEIIGACYTKPKPLVPAVFTDSNCSRPEGCGPVDPGTPVTPPGPPAAGELPTSQKNPTVNPAVVPPR